MGTIILVIIILMRRIKLMMFIGIMGIMGTAQVIPLLRSTQHGSTPLPNARKIAYPCPVPLCMAKNHNILRCPRWCWLCVLDFF
jgi:hypothetical protein